MQFLSGTWYEVEIPEDCALTPEEIYDLFWEEGPLPDGVEVTESECDHIWDDELSRDRPILALIEKMLEEDRARIQDDMMNAWLAGRIEALAQLQREVSNA